MTNICICIEVSSMLVDGVVSQMHKLILNVFYCWFLIELSAKSSYSLFMQEYSQRRDAVNEHVQSQIVFKSVNQVRSLNILLNHVTNTCLFF